MVSQLTAPFIADRFAIQMSLLPPAPDTFEFSDVTVRFAKVTDGDSSKGFVPGYHFRILDAAMADVGHINVRVGESEHVRLAAGHIGFEIKEPYRGHRYAMKACLAVSPWLSGLGARFLITVDPDNIPSLRTIERIGAVFVDEVEVPKNDPHFARGSRRKRRYEWVPNRTEQAHGEQRLTRPEFE